MKKDKTPPHPVFTGTKEQRVAQLLHYLLTVYGPKELERLRREYYQSIN